MRWWLLVIAAYLLAALEVGLAPGLGVMSRFGEVEPQFMMLLLVWVGLWAPAGMVGRAAAGMGLVLDLTTTWVVQTHGGSAAVVVIGPHVLGFLAGAALLVQLRPILVRGHWLTPGAMVVVSGVAVNLVIVGLLTVRSWYEPVTGWWGGGELLRRGLCLLYTAGIATAVWLVVRRWALAMMGGPPSRAAAWRPRR